MLKKFYWYDFSHRLYELLHLIDISHQERPPTFKPQIFWKLLRKVKHNH
jgi:hypothetical protein